MSPPNESCTRQTSTMIDEQALLQYTRLLKQQYTKLSEIVESVGRDNGRDIEPISTQMKYIKETESRLSPLRHAFSQSQCKASSELQQVTDETIELVKTLMPKLAELEKASVDSLRRLFPKIQGSVRAVQMQNAYKGNAQA